MILLSLFTDVDLKPMLCWQPPLILKKSLLHLIQPKELHYLQLGSEQGRHDVPEG